MPGTWTSLGDIDPTGTISSTSAIVTFAALHIGELKFRVDFLKSINITLPHVNDEKCKILGSR